MESAWYATNTWVPWSKLFNFSSLPLPHTEDRQNDVCCVENSAVLRKMNEKVPRVVPMHWRK